MTTFPKAKSSESEFHSKLDLLDLQLIKQKIKFSEGYDDLLINEMEVWYKKFLFLNFKYPDSKIVPNELIDEFWHYHILDTRKYSTDCNYLFGEMLHHYPYFGMRGEEDIKNLNECYEATKIMFLNEFGQLPFLNEEVQNILDKVTFSKAASCSDCSGETGTGT